MKFLPLAAALLLASCTAHPPLTISGGVPLAPLAEAASSQLPLREGVCSCGTELPREHIDTLFRSPEWIEIPRGARRVEALRRQAALTALGDWLITHPLCSARPEVSP